MIRRFCDICERQINRSYVGDRYRPSLYRASRNWSTEIIVCKGGTWNDGDLCLDCLKEILSEGSEYRTTPRLTEHPLATSGNVVAA